MGRLLHHGTVAGDASPGRLYTTASLGLPDFYRPGNQCVSRFQCRENRGRVGKAPKNFRSRYRPQLAAYWKAVSEITHFDVEAGLFSTALGCLLLYTADELQEEWNRLEQLPPAKLDEEMQPDAPDDF